MIPHRDEEFRDMENATALEIAARIAEIEGEMAVLHKQEMKHRKILKWLTPIWLIGLSMWMIGVSAPHDKFAWGVVIVLPAIWMVLWRWMRAGGITERDR